MFRIQLVRWLWLVCCVVTVAAAAAEDPTAQAIRASVERAAGAPGQRLKVGGMTLAEGVVELYRQRDFAPIWSERARIEQLLTALAGTAADGLDPEDYHLSALQRGYLELAGPEPAGAADAQRRAELDLLASNGYLLALLHLFRGKVDPARLDPRWNFSMRDIAPDQALGIVSEAIESGRIAAVFERARPDNPLYRNLRNGYAQLRALAATGGWPTLPAGPVLKPGMSDARVPSLRRRLMPDDGARRQDEYYDDALVEAVRQFQREQYLEADGIIGAATARALATPIQARLDQARVNLERGRWLLHEIQGDFVLVDIAGYKIRFFRDGKPVWSARVQVGKPYRSTPVFKSKVTYITFNPTWTVPPTILIEDILPKVRRDVGYLARNRIRVFDRAGRELDPEALDWSRPGALVLRQDSGPDNSLGRVAIRFPNAYSVYLHDTPHQAFFDRGQRALSSGCIRVERPLELVELLMNDPEHWGREGIDAAIAAGRTRNVTLARPVPILLMYWTVDVSENGHIAFKPDIYKRDPAVLKALDAKA